MSKILYNVLLAFYIQRVTKLILRFNLPFVIPLSFGENFSPFYHSIEYFKKSHSYIIDLFSLAFSYKACANNFITSKFHTSSKMADIAGDNVLVDEYALGRKKKEKEKKILSHS